MPKFFENISPKDRFYLNEENSRHCSKALRMKCGDRITVTNGGMNFECEIINISPSAVECAVISSAPCAAEPSVKVTLFQCLPKGDKLETVIQKSVELGAYAIQPVLSRRCVSRPDDKKSAKKTERYRKIAKSACEQSGRGIVVDVGDTLSFADAAKRLSDYDLSILFYEGGGEPIKSILSDNSDAKSIAVIIGPEGGFEPDEVKLAAESGARCSTLGKRILRTETAPLAAITAIMLLSGNME